MRAALYAFEKKCHTSKNKRLRIAEENDKGNVVLNFFYYCKDYTNAQGADLSVQFVLINV